MYVHSLEECAILLPVYRKGEGSIPHTFKIYGRRQIRSLTIFKVLIARISSPNICHPPYTNTPKPIARSRPAIPIIRFTVISFFYFCCSIILLPMAKKENIKALFDNIAPDYDKLNHILSLNIDKSWRRKAVREI